MFSNTHLKAKAPFKEQRVKQVKQLTSKIVGEMSKDETFIIAVGDYNEDSVNEPMTYIKDLGFKSAFEDALKGKEPEFTTFYHRESEGWKKRTIDYVFY